LVIKLAKGVNAIFEGYFFKILVITIGAFVGTYSSSYLASDVVLA